MDTLASVYLSIFLIFIKTCDGQYSLIRSKISSCENPKNTAPEQFFNLIFAEFQNPPPVCVCVQMCIEQAAYCYPNGCVKKLDRPMKQSTIKPVNNSIKYGTTQSIMFLVEKDVQFKDIFEVTSYKTKTENLHKDQFNELNSNPFKEFVVKYRRLPKLEMRYNLRERMKNSKAAKLKREKLDVTKAKWALTKSFIHGKQQFNKFNQNAGMIKENIFFTSVIPEIETVLDLPAYYKKFKSKRENAIIKEAVRLYGAIKANFSLDNITAKLLHNSLDNEESKTQLKKTTTASEYDIQSEKEIWESTIIDRGSADTKNNTNNNILVNTTTAFTTIKNNEGPPITTLSKEKDELDTNSAKIVHKSNVINNHSKLFESTKLSETLNYLKTTQKIDLNVKAEAFTDINGSKISSTSTSAAKRKSNKKRFSRKLL